MYVQKDMGAFNVYNGRNDTRKRKNRKGNKTQKFTGTTLCLNKAIPIV